MKITTALLADAARVEQGKLYIHGGGWDTIFTAATPVMQPSIALVLMFQIEYSEAMKPIPVEIELRDADENSVPEGPPPLTLQLLAGHSPVSAPGEPSFSPLAWTINMLRLPGYGSFRFRVSSSQSELASVPLRVALAPGAVGPGELFRAQ